MADEQDQAERRREAESRGFAALVLEHGPRIYRFCHRLCMNAADAEDLTQEVFLAAYQGLSRFQGRSSVETWLYRIAVFRWHVLRSRWRPPTVPLEDLSLAEAAGADPSQAMLAQLELDRALGCLPDPLRAAFLLVKGEGLRCREAAAVLGIPEGTVKYRVHQAIHRLRSVLGEGGEGSTPRGICPHLETCNEL